MNARTSSTALLLFALAATPALGINEGLPPPPSSIDRRTPLATVDGFLTHAHAEDYQTAAHYLDLSPIPKAEQAQKGPRLARRLKFVLDRKLWFDYSKISQDPAGNPQDGANTEHLGSVELGAGTRPIRLDRVSIADAQAWVFSAETVRAIDPLYQAYGAPLGERLPDFMFLRPFWILELWQWLGLLVIAALAFFAGYVLEKVILALSAKVARFTRFKWDDQVIGASRGPLRLLVASALFAAGSRVLLLPPPAQTMADILARSLVIASLAWFLVRFIRLFTVYVQESVAAESPTDIGRIRGLQTQMTILRHVLEVTIVVVAVALALMQFEVVRSVGVSLLASAGIAGLAIGLAAQKSLSALLAGIQLSITQPVRIGDTVVVENEFGTIEEVTLTYVVIKVWDLRRLVVPVTSFLDKPFQNLTRTQTELLGTVELRIDFTAEVDAIRAELKRILENEGAALWDKKVQGVQVTDATDRVMLVRVLVSAADAGKLFDLRCIVREKLFAYLKQQHPDWLPALRLESEAA